MADHLAARTQKLRLEDVDDDDASSVVTSTDTESVVHAGNHSSAHAQTAKGSVVEDQEFDGMLENMNADLPPHACR